MKTPLFRKTNQLCFVLAAFSATAQQATFAKKIRPSGAGGNVETAFCIDADNSMTMHILFQDSLTTANEAFLANYDSTGTLRWQQFLQPGTNSIMEISTTIQPVTGGHLSSGRTVFNNMGHLKCCTRTNAAGIPLWSRMYHNPLFEDLDVIKSRQRADGNFLVVSNLRNTAFFERSIHVMCIDSLGNPVWSNRYHPEPDLAAAYKSIALAQNQDLLIAGTATVINFTTGSRVMRIDGNGNLRWSKIIYFNLQFDGIDLAEGPGDSLWLLSSYADPQGISHLALTKMDSAGQMTLSRGYSLPGEYMMPRGIKVTPGGDVITYGMHAFPQATAKAFMMRTDAGGNIIWFRSFENLELRQAELTTSGGIAYCGYPGSFITSLVTGRKDFNGLNACDTANQLVPVMSALYPNLVNDTGYQAMPLTVDTLVYTAVTVPFYELPVCGLYNPNTVAETAQLQQVNVFPNPAGNRVTISGINGNSMVHIYNSNGQSCLQQTSNANELQLDLTPFAEGLYFIVIDNGAKRTTQKLLIQR